MNHLQTLDMFALHQFDEEQLLDQLDPLSHPSLTHYALHVLLHLVRWHTRAVRGLHVPDEGGDQFFSCSQSKSQVIRAHQRHVLVQRDEVVPKLSFTPRAQRHSRAAPRTQSQGHLRFDRRRLRDA